MEWTLQNRKREYNFLGDPSSHALTSYMWKVYYASVGVWSQWLGGGQSVGRFGQWGAKGGIPRDILLDIRQSCHKNLGKSKILRVEVLDFGFSDPVGYYLNLDIRKIQIVGLCLNIAAQTAIHRLFLTCYQMTVSSRAPRARLLSTQAPRRLVICYLPNLALLHYLYCILFGFDRRYSTLLDIYE